MFCRPHPALFTNHLFVVSLFLEVEKNQTDVVGDVNKRPPHHREAKKNHQNLPDAYLKNHIFQGPASSFEMEPDNKISVGSKVLVDI